MCIHAPGEPEPEPDPAVPFIHDPRRNAAPRPFVPDPEKDPDGARFFTDAERQRQLNAIGKAIPPEEHARAQEETAAERRRGAQ